MLARDIVAEDRHTDALSEDDYDAIASLRWLLESVLYDGAAGGLYRPKPVVVVT